MKLLLYIVFAIVVAGLSYQLYGAEIERREVLADLNETTDEMEELESVNKELKQDIEYLSNPHNLEKELRARFNYRAPNEDLIIIVPEEE